MSAPLPDPHPPSRAGSLSLLGGRLCLDFTNTSSGRGTPDRLEHLHAYGHLLAWGVHAGAIDGELADRLERAASGRPPEEGAEEGAAVVAQAVAFREALYRALLALAAGGEPDAADLDTVSRAFQRAAAHGVLRPREGGCVVAWDVADDPPLDAVLWPVAWSAAELLQRPAELARIKRCEACNCGWLFLDASKNRTRRWCSMGDCGNRAKARRHQLRRKLTGAGGAAF
ncbi:CGNR zinc finger domain-containing protein [Azospirillum sp.]|uniref:CGNR zinc finger domain-containing protein n=1 Tax=Azospirillum sp. TaxID=34012 RepID=UPI003D71F526